LFSISLESLETREIEIIFIQHQQISL